MGHPFEQRYVVARIAVEVAFRVIRDAPVHAGQPTLDATDLAILKAGNAARLAAEHAVMLLEIAGDQMRNAEFARDRGGHKGVGGGDAATQVAGGQVRGDQGARLGADRRHDHRFHIVGMPGVDFGARPMRQRRQGEQQVFVNVERAGLVALVEIVIFAVELDRIHDPPRHQIAAPGMVAVDRQQCVVEVEQGQVHSGSDWLRLSSSRSSGTVSGRLVCSDRRSSASSSAISEVMSRRDRVIR